MELLSGTVGDILQELDQHPGEWRRELLGKTNAQLVQHARRVALPREGVFYVERAQPGSSVVVSFVQSQDDSNGSKAPK